MGLFLAALTACGANETPPVDAAADAAVAGDGAVASATASTCSAWLALQRETDLPAVTGQNAAKRAAMLSAGGGFRKVDDTYYAAWFPAGHFDKSTRRVIFVLHGTDGAPEYEFADWQPSFEPRAIAFIGLKWGYADRPEPNRYSDGETLYKRMIAILDEMDAACGTKTADVSLLGFSRGSAQSFEVLARDRAAQKRLKTTIAVSGAWPTTMKPTGYLDALDIAGDTTAMTGGRMWMYCGGKDNALGEPMCGIMKNAKSWVEKHGGTVQKLYEDPNGDHHSMPTNPAAVADAFDYLESL
jgi:predicted esterase